MDADARRELRRRASLPIVERLMQLTSGWRDHDSFEGKATSGRERREFAGFA